MPKTLFHDLTPEKQSVIFHAGLTEFSTNPFDDASINQIVKRAGIARGSFYLYFEDKEDLFFYILETLLTEKLSRFIPTVLHEDSPDLFGSYRTVFGFLLTVLDDPEYYPFFASVYRHINYRINARITVMIEKFRTQYLYQNSRLAEKERPWLMEMVAVMGLIHRDLLERKVAEAWSMEQTMAIYDLRMSLLSKGDLQTVSAQNQNGS